MPDEVTKTSIPETTVNRQLMTKTETEPAEQPTPDSNDPITTQATAPSDTPELNVAIEQAAMPMAAEMSLEETVEDLPTKVETELVEGGSSDSYTWAPPEPTAFVPLSNQPLRAVKYATGSASPPTPPQQTSPANSKTDPWFEKQAPNQ